MYKLPKLASFLLALALPASALHATVTLTPNEDQTIYTLQSDAATGTYSDVISIGTAQLNANADKVGSSSVSINVTGNVTAGNYYQHTGDTQGKYYYKNGLTANFSGDFTIGGRTTADFSGTGTNVTITGNTLIQDGTCTATLNVYSGATFTANGGFQVNNTPGNQGEINLNGGTLNLNSSTANSIIIGRYSNVNYPSKITQTSGTLNIPNTTAIFGGDDGGHGTYLLNGGTANVYGLQFNANDSTTKENSYKYVTLQMNGGTLNLGAGGIVQGAKAANPLEFRKGTVSTLAENITSTINLASAFGDNAVTLTPKKGSTLKFAGTVQDSTVFTPTTNSKLEVKGEGTTEFAGTVSRANGFSVEGGNALLSGILTTKATVNSGTLKISSAEKTNTGTITANGGTVDIASENVYNAFVFNGGTLSTSLNGKTLKIWGPVTLQKDWTVNNPQRLEFRVENTTFTGANMNLTKDGDGELLFNGASTGKVVSPLKSITINSGTLTLQTNSQALVEGAEIIVAGGTLNYWGQANVNSAKTIFKGGALNAGANATSSTSSTAIFELQKDTTFYVSPYAGGDTAKNRFEFNGVLQSTNAVTLTKRNAGPMYMKGNADNFQGTIAVQEGTFSMTNGGNTADTAYNFGFLLNGGTLKFEDSGNYYFTDGTNLFNFAKATTVDLGTATIHVTGEAKISSAVAASLKGGTLDAGTVVFETAAAGNSVKELTLTDVNINASDISFSLTGDDLDYTKLTGQTLMTTGRTDLDGLTFNISSLAELPSSMFLYGLGQADGSIVIQTGVPEPATWVLMLVGMVLIFRGSRFQRGSR